MEFIDLGAQQARIKDRLEHRIQQVLAHGNYIMGPEVRELETGLASFCGATHALGCANGTDALQLALMALGVGVGDAVFCPTFTFASTAEVVPPTGATPIMVDVQPDSYNIDVESLARAIEHARTLGLRPAGIIPVDLFGLPADYDAIEAIASSEGMWVIADSAQGFGATYRGRVTGSIGTLATTSFFPAKPLGCYGDGGAVFTGDDELAQLIRSLRVHGKGSHKYDNERIGLNSRLDTLQAAVLLEKLAVYADEIEARQHVAARYAHGIGDALITPSVPDDCKSVWAQYTVRTRPGQSRESIMAKLKDSGIPTAVYYPRPLHQQTAYRDFPSDPTGLPVAESLAQEVFSLPMHPYLDHQTQDRVIEAVVKCTS
ncbi:DegT/DnrJ/EryC1/StrS aminotransferase family protein [Altererythrobacter arenosus]|uniref:DegT/DnrJ/EryC1/StrS aminotransferase family protein n=1 Tax=Altererythrobacter arenosus TaxID=3032592 RepID=A0ABY8FXI6_9SPHN|nr:DegT/DnrJ/EryC1/StrS aminotransferase family protein [Altererythrobacter sp. CAU 1644]WFL78708.1 DegT/DnrJ/EryC1/StrS aminotransferase family protein [Altererythrobacter sp. CAU 1644]